jgi:hypothetical protein
MDALQFGKMQAEVEQLQKDVADLKADVKTLLELANKGKGGFWAGMTLASMLGALASWFASHWPIIKG